MLSIIICHRFVEYKIDLKINKSVQLFIKILPSKLRQTKTNIVA